MGDWKTIDWESYRDLAALYHRTRPTCPADLVDRIVRNAGVGADDPIAEIGAGTGLFTRQLSGRGFAITALEPLAAMRAQAAALPDVTWADGTFEDTGLPDASQRWVVSCQAFQWADGAAALPEARRILRPDAWFTTVWYAPELASSPVLQRTYRLLREWIPRYGYVDRVTTARRLASRLLGALPARPQLALGRLASLQSARGFELQRSGDFGKIVYHEARATAELAREEYLDLWRSRNRLRTLGANGAFEGFMSAVADDLARHRVERLELTYIFGAWSARAAAAASATAKRDAWARGRARTVRK